MYDLPILQKQINDYDNLIKDIASRPESSKETKKQLDRTVSDLKSIIKNIEIGLKQLPTYQATKSEDLALKEKAERILKLAQIISKEEPTPAQKSSTDESATESNIEVESDNAWEDSDIESEDEVESEEVLSEKATQTLIEQFPTLQNRKIKEIDFKSIKMLGEGNLKTAYAIDHFSQKRGLTKTKVVVIPLKMRTMRDLREVQTELKINQYLKDIQKTTNVPIPNVCIGKQVIVKSSPTTKNIGILMNYYDRGDLEKVRKSSFSWEDVLQTTLQMATGLESLHKNHIIHRDVKEDNFFCSASKSPELTVSIADLGKSVLNHDTKNASDNLALPYVPPEALSNPKIVDYSSDIFALGVVFYDLAARIPASQQSFNIQNAMQKLKDEEGITPGTPNYGSHLGRMIKHLRDEDPDGNLDPDKCDRWPGFKEIPSESLKDLIKKMTDNDPTRRPDIATVKSLCEKIIKEDLPK